MISTRRAALLLPFAIAALAALSSCGKSPQQKAEAFVATYSQEYQRLAYDVNKAEWETNTHIVEGDTTNAARSVAAKKAMADFTGNTENIETTRKFLEKRAEFPYVLARELDYILYEGANNPASVADKVKQRLTLETKSVEKLYGYDYQIDGQSVSTNQIDDILRDETNLDKRLAAWETSKGVGRTLRGDLEQLQTLRNETVQPLGYKDYFSYQVSEYGMTGGELRAQMLQVMKELRPLYRELHTWARYELAKKYGVKEVPDMIPAHWLPNRWGQDWTAMVHVEGLDIDSRLKEKQPEWLAKQAESFYVSLGFDALPASFWERSSLYPAPEGADWKKNNHASAWHMDLDKDVRSLMS
ncbi:MAG TPA: M2 family metallopeptidase, partial [Candidatus Krumholzibacteria bacterium]